MKRSMLNKIVLGGLSALLLAMSAGQAQAEQGESRSSDEGKAAQVGEAASEQRRDRYLVVLMMREKSRHGSIYKFWFPQEPKYEAIVNDLTRRLGPPKSMLGRMLCGDLDPVACAEARPDRYRGQHVDIAYEGEPEGARALLKDFLYKCNLPWGQNPCQLYGEFVGYNDERLLEQIPPGAKYAILLRGSDGKEKIGVHGFGAVIGLCYDGPCKDRDALMEELFWSGVVPMLNLPWLKEQDRTSKQP